MQEHQSNDVTNPIQAASEIFYRPKAVFNTLANVNNWSWIPFLIVSTMLVLPTYLYLNLVDISWFIKQLAIAAIPDGSPAEIDNFTSLMTKETMILGAYFIPVFIILCNVIIAGYITFFTKDDEKNIQGFMDWFGAMWWIFLPFTINSLLACLLLTFQDPGTQIQSSIVQPLSFAFILGTDMTSMWFGVLSWVRLDVIWSVVIAAYCLNSWTSFTFRKSLILASIPALVVWTLSILFAI